MADPTDSFNLAQTLIDDTNGQDPTSVINPVDGDSMPSELLYSQHMSQRLASFAPEASDALKLAVRAQHIQRWKIPRSHYPMNRPGYLQWRRELGRFHARTCSALLAQAGYTAEFVERVSELLTKKNRPQDLEAQILEDVACLVFLEYYLADFAPKHGEEKLRNIIRKTWKKMSPKAQQTALGLSLPSNLTQLIEVALSPVP